MPNVALELFPIDRDRTKALDLCFNEHLYPIGEAGCSDDALGGLWLPESRRTARLWAIITGGDPPDGNPVAPERAGIGQCRTDLQVADVHSLGQNVCAGLSHADGF